MGSMWRSSGTCGTARTAHSLASALSLYNARLHTISPKGLELPATLAARTQGEGMEITEHDSVGEVIGDVDVLYVTRIQRERFPDSASYFNVASSYRITPGTAGRCKEAAHRPPPPPPCRRESIPGWTSPRMQSTFEQSRNGVPVRMAMLMQVMK